MIRDGFRSDHRIHSAENKVLKYDPTAHLPQRPGDPAPTLRNLNPLMHPFARARERLRDGFSFVSGRWDRTVRIWEEGRGHAPEVYHTKCMGRVSAALFTSDARFVLSGSDDSNMRLWKADASARLGVVAAPPYADVHAPSLRLLPAPILFLPLTPVPTYPYLMAPHLFLLPTHSSRLCIQHRAHLPALTLLSPLLFPHSSLPSSLRLCSHSHLRLFLLPFLPSYRPTCLPPDPT
ncbi:hypothetical protein C8J57DRAFT_1731368 [Mycena rebaudengoi]|nr:hypothetical protein C8J57DRAFT_1731368 [Mycena rebaudengoi]